MREEKGESIKKIILQYIFLNLLVFIALFLVMQLWKSNIIKYPLMFGGDATQVIYTFEQLKEGGVFGFSDRIGYPYYTQAADFPTLGLVSKILRWSVLFFTNNSVFSINLIYLSGFFFAATASYYVLRKIGVSYGVSMVASILYAFLPYHFMRGISHMAYSNYWPIPLLIFYCLSYMKGDQDYEIGKKFNKKNLLHIFTLIILGGHCVYYTYFSCFFICVVILYSVIKKVEKKRIMAMFFDLGIMLCTLVFTVIPYVYGILLYGKNTEVANRKSTEVEIYGLKIAQLLLPIDGHRISLFDHIGDKYREMPLTTENQMSAMGILLACGFVILVIELFKESHKDKDVFACAVLNIGAVLLSTIGGFASVIALFFSKIRCYNRLSVFIAFFCAIALAKTVDKYLSKLHLRPLYVLLCALLLGVGLFDQTSSLYVPAYKYISKRWENDSQFVAMIEEVEEEGAQIYQMPYVKYPEANAIKKMDGYDHSIGYLHSEDLVWSYGCYSGREGDAWNRFVDSLPLEKQVQYIYLNGFDGIYLDGNAYEKEELAQLLDNLAEIVDTKPLVDANEKLYYFTLDNYLIQKNEDEIYLSKIYWELENGFYPIEKNQYEVWSWSSGEGQIEIYNAGEKSIFVEVIANIATLKEGDYAISVQTADECFEYSILEKEQNLIQFPVMLKPGKNVVNFSSNIPSQKVGNDARELSFCLKDFACQYIEEVEDNKTFFLYRYGDWEELYFISGLSVPEEKYTWTEGNTVELYCDLQDEKSTHCTIGTEYVYNGKQEIVILVNGTEVFRDIVFQGEDIEFDFISNSDGWTNIEIGLPNAISPKKLGESKDDRLLGIAIRDISFENE